MCCPGIDATLFFCEWIIYGPATGPPLWTVTAGSAGDEPSKTQPPAPETPQMTKLANDLDAVQKSHQMWGKRPDMMCVAGCRSMLSHPLLCWPMARSPR